MSEDDGEPELKLYRQPFKRNLKERGNRSSRNAVETIREQVEDYGTKIMELATQYAEHADRKTVREEDVQQAIKQVHQQL